MMVSRILSEKEKRESDRTSIPESIQEIQEDKNRSHVTHTLWRKMMAMSIEKK